MGGGKKTHIMQSKLMEESILKEQHESEASKLSDKEFKNGYKDAQGTQ